MSVRSLTYLFCSQCSEIQLHNAERCIHCSQPNQQSGNPPVPKPTIRCRSPEGEQRRIRVPRGERPAMTHTHVLPVSAMLTPRLSDAISAVQSHSDGMRRQRVGAA